MLEEFEYKNLINNFASQKQEKQIKKIISIYIYIYKVNNI